MNDGINEIACVSSLVILFASVFGKQITCFISLEGPNSKNPKGHFVWNVWENVLVLKYFMFESRAIG